MLAGDEDEGADEGSSLFVKFVKLAIVFFIVNFFVQIYRKPTELLRFTGLSRTRTPRQTWDEYGEEFSRYATPVITADLLAGLVQVESAGDSWSSPGWTLHWSANPWRWYAPASSAVGVLQMTDGNFGAARSLCVKNGRVQARGAWYDPRSCGFGGERSRLAAADSIEMTSAFLHVNVERALAGMRHRVALLEKQKLAAVMHLCGPGMGPAFVRSGFNESAMGYCGNQSVRAYVRAVMKYRDRFARLTGAPSRPPALAAYPRMPLPR